MRVSSIECVKVDDRTEVSAEIDGFRLWYRLPAAAAPPATLADAFLSAALLPAMRLGEPLDIHASLPVSPTLLRNAGQMQEVVHAWNPRELKTVDVRAATADAGAPSAGRACFFSGGVDSTYTLLKWRGDISHAVNIHGFDFHFPRTAAAAGAALSLADIKDLSQLAWKLAFPGNALCAYLKGRLAPATLVALGAYCASGADPASVEAALLRDLNVIVGGNSIYEARRFAGVKLRPETRTLLADPGAEAATVNRRLLEDAFARELHGKYGGAYEAACERNRQFVESVGIPFLTVETNFYAFGYRYNLSRNLSQGACLGSIAVLLGMPQVFVPGSYSYAQLIPLGSHPLTDPLWSNGRTTVVHDGCEATRAEKVRAIAECPAALDNLRVCFHDANRNCGSCPKCLRTMIALALLGVRDAPFPPLPAPDAMRRAPLSDDVERPFLLESLELAREVGNAPIGAALAGCLRRADRRRLLGDIDRVALNGRIAAIRNRLNGKSMRRIDTTPPHKA